nr:MAG TPA: hypothetical protein [Caudoviricetes sp.]
MPKGAFAAIVSSVEEREGGVPAAARMVASGVGDCVTAPLAIFEPLRASFEDPAGASYLCLGMPDGTGIVLCRIDGSVS